MNRFPVENIDKVEEAESAVLASKATQLETSRTIKLSGGVTGSASFDGTGDASITATVADDSHSHTIANVNGLQDTLDTINSDISDINDTIESTGASLSVNGTSLSLNDANGNSLSTVSLPETVSPGDTTPLVAGTAEVGTSTKYAREDHVHPLQTVDANGNELDSYIHSVATGPGTIFFYNGKGDETKVEMSSASAAKLTTARKITLPKAYMYNKTSDAYVMFDGSANVSFACNGCSGCSGCTGSCTGGCDSCSTGCDSCSSCSGNN